jgi:hypothetical protein
MTDCADCVSGPPGKDGKKRAFAPALHIGQTGTLKQLVVLDNLVKKRQGEQE